MKRIIYVTTAALVLNACSSDNQKTTNDRISDAIDEAMGETADEFTGKLDELLTLNLASDISGLSGDEAEIYYNQVLKNPRAHSLSYSWVSDRKQTIEVAGRSMEVPVQDKVEICWVGSSTLEQFKQNYHNLTDEEKRSAAKAMEKKMGEMVENGEVTKDQADMAGGFADGLMENYKVTDVTGVGEHAVWIERKIASELKVYYKGLEFQLNVNLSDDEAINKEKSIALARRIISEKL